MPSNRSFPPLLCARGIRPTHAANWRPDRKSEAVQHGRCDRARRDCRQSMTDLIVAVPGHNMLLDLGELDADDTQLVN
jgi:hypothetical protein